MKKWIVGEKPSQPDKAVASQRWAATSGENDIINGMQIFFPPLRNFAKYKSVMKAIFYKEKSPDGNTQTDTRG